VSQADEIERWSRRGFLGFAGAAAGAAASGLLAADRAFAAEAVTVRAAWARDPEADADWRDVVAGFDLAPRIVLNAANLAPASRAVRNACTALAASVDADPSFHNRARFRGTREVTRARVASFVGADPDEVVLTRNTTEGNAVVIQGLDLGPGDEVVVSAHNHPSNLLAWHVMAERRGFSVVEVPVPTPAPSPARLMEDVVGATTDDTRVIAISHVTNLAGCRYPAGDLCSFARERGILTLVDGAQTCGVLALDLHEMGCDFYTASGHKWPCGPRESGLLYVRRDAAAGVWPGIVGIGWHAEPGPARFESLGQRDDAAIATFGHAVALLERIGAGAVEARITALASSLKHGLAGIRGIEIYTPLDPEGSAGIVTFHLDGVDPSAASDTLYREHGIVCAPSGVARGGLRFSPHVYNTLQQCETAVSAVRGLVGAG
jgi:selenocysteine lyase/cysteine desulfurase